MITIPLTKGYKALVDDEDAPLAGLRWYAHVTPWGIYAERTVGSGAKKQSFSVHREVARRMGLPEEGVPDHVDGNTLDNQRANIRVVSVRQNARNIAGPRRHNTSGYLGVSFDRSRNKWMAHINDGHGFKNLGRFDTPEVAYQARLQAEQRLWGIEPRRAAAFTVV